MRAVIPAVGQVNRPSTQTHIERGEVVCALGERSLKRASRASGRYRTTGPHGTVTVAERDTGVCRDGRR